MEKFLDTTVAYMISADYKERFQAEYWQTKIRYEKLRALNTRIEAANASISTGKAVEMPKHDCPEWILCDQQRIMGEYLHMLELRAAIEGIDITE